MGKRRHRSRQTWMWVATADLPQSAGHPFYQRLNRVRDDAGFDAFVERQCAPFYADGIGQRSHGEMRQVDAAVEPWFERRRERPPIVDASPQRAGPYTMIAGTQLPARRHGFVSSEAVAHRG